jgi:hypothetical protein
MKKHLPIYLSSSMLLLALSLFFSGPLQAQASAGHATRAWHLVPSPNTQQPYNMLNGVAAFSAQNAWAVGTSLGFRQPNQALSEHWDGKTWSIMPTPVIGEGSSLYAVSTIPHTRQLWAVGNTLDTQHSPTTYQTLAERWDGKQWSVVPTPFFKTDPENTSDTLYSVSALSPDNAWAVGVYDNGQGLMQTALIEHWNGKQWQAMAAPLPANSGISFLYGVTALSAKNVWAVGVAGTKGRDVTLIDHWNGTIWSLVAAPSPGTIANFLYGVARIGNTNQLWAVGNTLNDGGAYQTLIERWDGKQWSVVASPGTNDNTLQSVAADAPNDAWAVGSDTSGNGDQPLFEHWNGSSWSLVDTPTPANSNTVFLSSVTSIPHTRHYWAVGNYYATVNNQFDQFTLTEVYR